MNILKALAYSILNIFYIQTLWQVNNIVEITLEKCFEDRPNV
jgi:hypothetical protein